MDIRPERHIDAVTALIDAVLAEQDKSDNPVPTDQAPYGAPMPWAPLSPEQRRALLA